MRASVVFNTGRPEPHLDWLLDGLEAQATPGDEFELVVVDTRAESRDLVNLLGGRAKFPACVTDVRHTLPKPNPWQGPHRVTREDWWAVSNARNTGICLASADYVAFVDDRAKLGPHWVEALRYGWQHRVRVRCGSYQKHEGGKVTQDHRYLSNPGGKPDCGGGWLYGCNFALPLDWLLEVNGFEEGCDGLSGEDYTLGAMLANRGYRLDFDTRLFVYQDRSEGTGHGCRRTDKGKSPRDKSHVAIERFGRRTHTEFTPDLARLRSVVQAGGEFPVGNWSGFRDWYDGQLVSEMAAP